MSFRFQKKTQVHLTYACSKKKLFYIYVNSSIANYAN